MRPIYEAEVAQIDILSACHLKCANCTRFVGHHAKNFVMSEDCFETAIKSLEGFPGRIGIMGGEPCLHPNFLGILAIYRKLVPKDKREFWTAGHKWEDYEEEIYETFHKELIHYNDHTQSDGKHQPLLVAVQEVVEDEDLMWELINNCPFQEHWSPAINDQGAYFCEIGASLDRVIGGENGWEVKPGWWDKTPEDPEFIKQKESICVNCSGCLPLPKESDGRGGRDGPTYDTVSKGNVERLLRGGSPKAAKDRVKVFEGKITREQIEKNSVDWSPRSFRGFVAHNPEDVEEALG